ncbi:MAG: gene transfer agent family protein [Asticcacaulis sp.]
MSLFNPARGEVLATLGGREVRLCVTLRALAVLEAHFGVTGFEALGARLGGMGASDVQVVLRALVLDEVEPEAVGFKEALAAIVAALAAMNA